jgi:hypothetical protein
MQKVKVATYLMQRRIEINKIWLAEQVLQVQDTISPVF